MSDESVAECLRSDNRLVVIEAPAGCGKTWQGASYARDIACTLGNGRLLILTHTHAACGVFAERTKGAGTKVEIRTIDALVAQIASAYHKSLGLPSDISAWTWHDGGNGFTIAAQKVATFLDAHPMVARALAHRYPIIICDEHQDSTTEQHAIVMALHRGGSLLRIFGDPVQRIYGHWSDKAAQEDRARWEALKAGAACEKLDYPHRWDDGCSELGKWVLAAREQLDKGEPIDLTGTLPPSVRILNGNNTAMQHNGYILSREHRRPIYNLVRELDQVMVLAARNKLVTAIRAFWGRSMPIWEGHTREALALLVADLREKSGDAEALARGLIDFMGAITAGFSKSSHGDRLLQEVSEGCVRNTWGKPANIQAVAQCIVDDPSHTGIAAAINLIGELIEQKEVGFDNVKIDNCVEFRDAIRVGQFTSADEAFAEIARKRSYTRPSPPARVISSIHKAKGLECDIVLVMACDRTQFSDTIYSRCRMYVALSRAKRSLTLVIPETNPSPLFRRA